MQLYLNTFGGPNIRFEFNIRGANAFELEI